MNVLVFDASVAETIINNQSGQHRLGPVALADGRYFLSTDVLTDPRFAVHLEGVEYEEATLEDVQHLIPAIEDVSL